MLSGLLPWFSLMIAGLVASVVLLLWGVRSGQFADQERARYLPLRDAETPVQGHSPGALGPEVYALVGLMAIAGVALGLALGLAIFRQYGG
ncbi:MAG: hypothetical protein ABSC19_07650 [Syntrophorhabdales bacterium]|jgi:cbb3-type cytochrome oxidase maturation protein